MVTNAPLLLIVEDTPALARALARRATSVGWKSLHASSLPEARDLIQRITFDAWIIDRDLAGEEGMTLVRDHESSTGTGARRRRPRTALWTTAPHAPPVDTADFDVAVFGKLDVEGMLAWLTQEDVPPPRRRATGLTRYAISPDRRIVWHHRSGGVAWLLDVIATCLSPSVSRSPRSLFTAAARART